MEHIASILDAVCLAARIILESGGETYRAEESAERMCRGLGVSHAEVVALPTSLMLMVDAPDGGHHTRIVRVRRQSTDLMRVDQCNSISRKVSSGQMTAEDALIELRKIHAQPAQHRSLLIAASAFAAGAFTVMLGGIWTEFIISVFCGALIQLIQIPLVRRRVPGMLQGLMSGAVISLIALIGALIIPSVDIEPIISGAIMPIIPGLATANAIRDTLRGDMMSGGTRIMEALLSVITLAAGIGFTLAVWGGLH